MKFRIFGKKDNVLYIIHYTTEYTFLFVICSSEIKITEILIEAVIK